jgi:hypothetical protein
MQYQLCSQHLFVAHQQPIFFDEVMRGDVSDKSTVQKATHQNKSQMNNKQSQNIVKVMSSTLLEHARQNLEACEKLEASVGTYLEETPSGVRLIC